MSEFDNVYENYLANLLEKHPELTSYNLRLAALVKLQLSNKEIASILNIAESSVKKAKGRLKQKIPTLY